MIRGVLIRISIMWGSYSKYLMRMARTTQSQTSSSHVILGRWALHDNPALIDLKVDYSNEGHCGTCSSLLKKESHIDTDDTEKNEWMYMAGTVM